METKSTYLLSHLLHGELGASVGQAAHALQRLEELGRCNTDVEDTMIVPGR